MRKTVGDGVRVSDILSGQQDDTEDVARVWLLVNIARMPGDRVVEALIAAGWDDERIAHALSVGWDGEIIVEVLTAAGWDAERITSAMIAAGLRYKRRDDTDTMSSN